MPLRRYRLYASTAATANAADSMQFPRAGTLKQILLCVRADSVTDNSAAIVSVSRVATRDNGNAASGGYYLTPTLAQFSLYGNFVTSGLSQPNLNQSYDLNDKVNLGDTLYLHFEISGTITAIVDVIVVIDEGSGS